MHRPAAGMGWGSTVCRTSGDPCQTCPALCDCRQAVRTGQPVACEDKPIPHKYLLPGYSLTPGQVFTTADLMAATGQTLRAAGEWCQYHRVIIGDIELIGVKAHNRKVYRYTSATSPKPDLQLPLK